MGENPSSMPRALIVCDEPDSGPLWASNLARKHISAILSPSVADAIHCWAEVIPDLIILDVKEATPAILDLIAELRSEVVNPILVLCGKWEEESVLNAYAAGADDFIRKPISPQLFLAKVQAWLRRSWTISTTLLETIQVGDFCLVPSEHHLIVKDGSAVALTNLELRLLHLLLCRPNKTVSTAELIQRMWGYRGEGDVSALKNIVYRLRHKIEMDPANPRHLGNVPGVGYKFISE